MLSRREVLGGCFIAVGVAGCGRASAVLADEKAPAKLISAAALQQDADILEATLRALHPGIHRYLSPAEFDGRLAVLRTALNHDQEQASVFLALSQFTAALRCGHTYPNFYNQSNTVQRALFETPGKVPFQFRWLAGRMIVTRNLSTDARLVSGSEILSVDGFSTAALLNRLMTVARADGSNDAKRKSELEVRGDSRYEAFDVYLPLLFPKITDPLPLTFRDPAGRQHTAVLRGATYAERLASRVKSVADDAAPWALSYPQPDVALLEMPTWAMYNRRWDWREFLNSVFVQLEERHTKSLVIDIRANEGGDDVGRVLISHLVGDGIAPLEYQRLVRYRTIPATLAPYLDTWDPSFRDWGAQAVAAGDEFYRLQSPGNDAPDAYIMPQAPHFGGRVIVLTGPVNSSATFQFVLMLKIHGLATLVGEPTGGNRRGLNGGAFFFLRLPNSGLEVDVPLIGTFPASSEPDAGVEPDVLVAQTAADVAAGRDRALERAFALAEV